MGDPVTLGAAYSDAGADELVFLDIRATLDGRQTLVDLVARVAERLAIPFTVGGGVRSVADADELLQAGADKVAQLRCARAAGARHRAGREPRRRPVVAIDAEAWRVGPTPDDGDRAQRRGGTQALERGAYEILPRRSRDGHRVARLSSGRGQLQPQSTCRRPLGEGLETRSM